MYSNQSSPEKQNLLDKFMHREIYFKEFGQEIVEICWIPNLQALTAGQRPRKSCRWSAQALLEFLLAQGQSGFGPTRPSTDWMRPTHVIRVTCFKSTDSNVNAISRVDFDQNFLKL